jgi:hypothetical protein
MRWQRKLHKKHFESNHNVTSNQAKTNMTIMTGHNLQSYPQNIRSHYEQHPPPPNQIINVDLRKEEGG